MKKIFLIILLAVCVFSVNARSFSLQIIQKNTPGEDVFDTSYIVEQTVLDYFFDRGLIVSNNAVIVSNKDEVTEKTQLHRSFIEAKMGCMDLLVKLYLDYEVNDSTAPDVVLLSSIKDAKLEIQSLEDAKTLVKGRFTPPAVTDLNNNQSGVENFALDIAMEIQAELAGKGGAI